MHYIIALLLLYTTSFSNSEGINCGKPGRPSNGTISPLGNSYYPGEKVSYKCIEGFILFGEESRTCQKNGSWSGDTPLCDFNLARDKSSLQSDTLWSYSPELAVDGNVNTCSFTPRSPEPRWWQVHLGHKFNIVSVGITISPGSFQEFTIYVIELLEGNKALYKPCTTFKGVFQTHKGMFKCNDGIGHPGQFVYVRDDRKEEEYFGLCEVEVFAYRERIPCGDPEVPVKGTATGATGEKITYTCATGYKLEGTPTVVCISKGNWHGKIPKCEEIKCDSPIHIENGYIEIGNSKGEYVYGTKAKYGCSPGYHLNGLRQRICSEEGKWSGETPSCKVVSCGPPPTFPNTRYTMINGSNQWAGIAVYTCEEGFALQFQNEDTVTTCLDNGEWKFINITCLPILITSAISRGSHGRAINYEVFKGPNSEQSMPKVVIALAVIAGLLATSLVILGAVMIRKRLLSQPNSSLTISVDKNEDKERSVGSAHKSSSYSNFQCYDHPTEIGGDMSQDQACLNITLTPEIDHNYETLGKSAIKNLLPTDIAYGDIPSDDKQSVGYEVIANGKEPGYATIKSTKSKDENMENDYETLKEKDSGYETIKGTDILCYGYDIVGSLGIQHGYETIKPKLPPPNSSSLDKVPDILQNLNSSEISSPVNVYKYNGEDIPPQILALYAKIDKSKKKKKPIINNIKIDVEETTETNKLTDDNNGSAKFITRLNSLPSEEEHAPTDVSSESSSINSIRPLPAIPN